jgi:predicted ATPase
LYGGDEFPFNVPAVANIEQLDLSKSVTLLTGENGRFVVIHGDGE